MERISIETERLRIGEWMPELAGTLCRLSQNEGNRLFLPDEVFETVEAAQTAIAEWMANRRAGTGMQSCPVFQKGGSCIGHVALCPLEDWDGEAWEIEYHVAEKFRGHNYATEAVRAFLPTITAQLSVKQLRGICPEDNHASRRVLEQCGFEKYRESAVVYYGQPTTIVFYRYDFQKRTWFAAK